MAIDAAGNLYTAEANLRGVTNTSRIRSQDGRFPHIARREGRVHFAGEHASSMFLYGRMLGALESGIRAAREVDAA